MILCFGFQTLPVSARTGRNTENTRYFEPPHGVSSATAKVRPSHAPLRHAQPSRASSLHPHSSRARSQCCISAAGGAGPYALRLCLSMPLLTHFFFFLC